MVEQRETDSLPCCRSVITRRSATLGVQASVLANAKTHQPRHRLLPWRLSVHERDRRSMAFGTVTIARSCYRSYRFPPTLRMIELSIPQSQVTSVADWGGCF